MDESPLVEKIESERLYTLEDMKKAYEWGQIDCGEFFNIMGFELWNKKEENER